MHNNFKILIHNLCLQSKEKPALSKRGSKSSKKNKFEYFYLFYIKTTKIMFKTGRLLLVFKI